MFDTKNPYAQRFVPDYPLFLIHPNEISDFGQFQSEFGSLMQILSVSEDRERMNEILYGMQDNDTMISRNALEILRKFTGLSVKMKKKEEVVEMGRLCKALEEQRRIDLEEGRKFGIEEGRKSGLEEGRKFGIEEGQKAMEKERKNIASQMKNEGFSIALIAKILQLSENGVNQLLS